MCQTLSYADFSTGQKIAEFSFAVVLGLILIAYPIWIYVFMRKKEDQLPNPRFKAKYDSIYQNLDYYKKDALPHTAFFLLRRLCFAILIAFSKSSIVL